MDRVSISVKRATIERVSAIMLPGESMDRFLNRMVNERRQPAVAAPRAACQCEDSHCTHGDRVCPNEGAVRVSPSYLMCGPCAEQWQKHNPFVKKVAPRQAGKPRLTR
jgi:hypothetical protein